MAHFAFDQNHGIDQLASLDISLGDVAQMGREERLQTRRRLDEVASACEEELDFEDAHKRCALPYPRADKAKVAQVAKNALFAPHGPYDRIRAACREIAQTDLELREWDIRGRQADYEHFNSDPEVTEKRDVVRGAAGKRKIILPVVGTVDLESVHEHYYYPDERVREATTRSYRGLDDIEALALPVIGLLDEKVRSQSKHPHFLDVVARQTELPDSLSLEQMLRRFVAETKDVYERLFRELISTEAIKPWNLEFLISKKDPFFRAQVPTDPSELLDAAVALLGALGYPHSLRDLYKPGKPGVFIDLEEREGKHARAVTYTLGAFSRDKNILVYNPRTYRSIPRERWRIFHHELARGVHYEMSRRAASVYGAAFSADGKIASTTITSIHKALAMEPSFLSRYIAGVDQENLHKWNVFSDLRRLYRDITLALGEILIHRGGVEHARDAFYEAMKLTQSDLVEPGPTPSPSYIASSHLWSTPGVLFTYPFGDFYAVAVVQKLRDAFGSLPCAQVGPFLMEKLMTGNIKSIHDRVVATTGTGNLVDNAARYFRNAVK